MADSDTDQSLNSEPMNHRLRRPRFSLLTLLLLMTVAGMGVALVRQGIEIVPLREEVRRMRDELGILHIDDPEKIYAIRVESDNTDYLYRLHIPMGSRLHINYAYSDIPASGVPDSDRTVSPNPLEPGGYLLRVKLKRSFSKKTGKLTNAGTMVMRLEPTDGQKSSAVVSASAGASVGVRGNWIHNEETGQISTRVISVGREAETFSADESVELLRLKATPYTEVVAGEDGENIERRYENADKPGVGFLIWIEE